MFDAILSSMISAEVIKLKNEFNLKPIDILLVEDDELMKPIIAKLLTKLNLPFNMRWASSVEDAKVILAQKSFHLVISDFLLGKSPYGSELRDYCQKLYPTTPFFLISGLSLETVNRLSGTKIFQKTDYLGKPLHFESAKQKILNLLARNHMTAA